MVHSRTHHDPEYWRRRAKMLRTAAVNVKHEGKRQAAIQKARDCEKCADELEATQERLKK